jgi:hypothetical protein
MKAIFNKTILAMSILAISLTACKKEDVEPDHDHDHTGNGTVSVKMNHLWSSMTSDTFKLNTQYIHPMSGDTMTFSTYKYYVSNFKLKKADGTWFVHPEGYFLVDLSNNASGTLNLGSIPEGEYTEMEYTMGVDSLRNCSGAQTGALSTTNNMFWSWNSGYIMIKAEGQSPNAAMGDFAFHLGGYKGDYNVVTKKTVSFSSNNLTVTKDKNSQVHIKSFMAKTWHTTGSISSGSMIMMPNATAKQMATDFYSSFSFSHLVE